MRRIRLLGMPWKRLTQLRIIHPIQRFLPTPELSAVFAQCMARRADEVPAGEVLKALNWHALQRYHYMDWWDYPHSDRAYYISKWGGEGRDPCGEGTLAYPYGDLTRPLSHWAWNETMRREIMAYAHAQVGKSGDAAPGPGARRLEGTRGGPGASAEGGYSLLRGIAATLN